MTSKNWNIKKNKDQNLKQIHITSSNVKSEMLKFVFPVCSYNLHILNRKPVFFNDNE